MYYLYAVVEGLPSAWRPPPPVFDGAIIGRHRFVGLSVLGSLLRSLPPSNGRTAALHHDVVASALDARAVVPLGVGTAVPLEELEPWLRERRAKFEAALARVRGRVEMSVRLLRLGGADGGRADDGALRALADQLVERAGVEQWRCWPGAESQVVTCVSFLLPRAELPDFLARIAPVASRADGVAVVPTGPWPAYSFVPALGRPPVAAMPWAPPAGRRAG